MIAKNISDFKIIDYFLKYFKQLIKQIVPGFNFSPALHEVSLNKIKKIRIKACFEKPKPEHSYSLQFDHRYFLSNSIWTADFDLQSFLWKVEK